MVEFGDDEAARRRRVVAVGNPRPLQLGDRGIVSSWPQFEGASTTTSSRSTPINRGNSGGPTFDLRGQVIGMNSMISSPGPVSASASPFPQPDP
jgi:serine protease Do